MKYAVVHVYVLAGDGYVEGVECLASFDNEEEANAMMAELLQQGVIKGWDQLFVMEIK